LLGLLLLCFSFGLTASAQTSDQIQSLKDSLSSDQQDSLLQGVLGNKGNGTNTKSDKKLQTPETVKPRSEEMKDFTKPQEKTRDGRILRQFDEDPELRPDDTVMIEMTPVEDICNRYGLGPNSPNNANVVNQRRQ
jgi:hypothetical protein